MNIRLGVYDVFSRTVSGGFYTAVFVQFLIVAFDFTFDWKALNELKIIPGLILILIAYILGTAIDPIASKWHRLFKKRGMSDRVLNDFKEKHAEWSFDFQDKDWSVLRAYIGIHDLELAGDIDRNNALAIMLRNISFGFMISTLIQIYSSVIVKDLTQFAIAILLAFLSYQIGIRARELRKWFYESIFETILAYQLDLNEKVKLVKTAPRGKSAK
jgi:hypothetical protein